MQKRDFLSAVLKMTDKIFEEAAGNSQELVETDIENWTTVLEQFESNHGDIEDQEWQIVDFKIETVGGGCLSQDQKGGKIFLKIIMKRNSDRDNANYQRLDVETIDYVTSEQDDCERPKEHRCNCPDDRCNDSRRSKRDEYDIYSPPKEPRRKSDATDLSRRLLKMIKNLQGCNIDKKAKSNLKHQLETNGKVCTASDDVLKYILNNSSKFRKVCLKNSH